MTGPAGAPGHRLVDLHLHSTASDGALPPADVVVAAARVGLVAIALTDHDSVAGVAEARAAGERTGVRVVTGVELSAMDGDCEVHLLGLHLTRVEAVEQRLAFFRDGRRARAEEIVRRLAALGIPVTMEAVLRHAGGGAIGRPHVARALVEGGWAADVREAFERWLGNGRPAFVPKIRLTSADAIALVHEAGGLAVLAHPGVEGTRARVERFAAAGLDGLEVRHPGHSPDDAARVATIAEQFRLVPSGGSDWHGTPGGPRHIGTQRVPYEWLVRQEERLAERGARERVA